MPTIPNLWPRGGSWRCCCLWLSLYHQCGTISCTVCGATGSEVRAYSTNPSHPGTCPTTRVFIHYSCGVGPCTSEKAQGLFPTLPKRGIPSSYPSNTNHTIGRGILNLHLLSRYMKHHVWATPKACLLSFLCLDTRLLTSLSYWELVGACSLLACAFLHCGWGGVTVQYLHHYVHQRSWDPFSTIFLL